MSNVLVGIIGFTVLFIALIIFTAIRDRKLLNTVTKLNRGTRSERDLVVRLLKQGIPAQMIFHDLYLEKQNGGFTQIDLVVLTEVGIIVFEVKDYKGWIYGNGNYSQWTQVLAYGKKKYRFYNPIKQNSRHIAALRKRLGHWDNLPFYSIVLFYGDCEFKDVSFIPSGTFLAKSERLKKVMKNITKKNDHVRYSNLDETLKILSEAVANGESKENRMRHIENVKDMLGKDRIFD